MKKKRGEREMPWYCVYCGEEFDTAEEMELHVIDCSPKDRWGR